jgi:hypothetical protein
MRTALIALVLAAALSTGAYAEPPLGANDKDCLMPDDLGEVCIKSSKGMSEAQIEAWLADYNIKIRAEYSARQEEVKLKDAAEAKRVDAANEACKISSDWKSCGDNYGVIGSLAYGAISVSCERAAEVQAQYNTEWPRLPFRTTNNGSDALATGKIVVFEDRAKFQNVFGAMARVSIMCEYDLNAKTAAVTITE